MVSFSQFTTEINQTWPASGPTKGLLDTTLKPDLNLKAASLEAIFMKNGSGPSGPKADWYLKTIYILCIWSLDIRPSDVPKAVLRFNDRKKCCANFSPNCIPLCSKKGQICLKVCTSKYINRSKFEAFLRLQNSNMWLHKNVASTVL